LEGLILVIYPENIEKHNTKKLRYIVDFFSKTDNVVWCGTFDTGVYGSYILQEKHLGIDFYTKPGEF